MMDEILSQEPSAAAGSSLRRASRPTLIQSVGYSLGRLQNVKLLTEKPAL